MLKEMFCNHDWKVLVFEDNEHVILKCQKCEEIACGVGKYKYKKEN